MTDIRDLLRAASSDVEVDPRDPVERIRRALRRRRSGQAAMLAVVAIVAAAIAVPLALTGRSTVAPINRVGAGPTPVTQRWAPRDGDVAAGFGSLWALACCDKNVGRSWVDQLDPRTGALIHRIAVRTPTSQIAVGAGHVWVIGQNPGGGGPTEITAIDPTTLKTVADRSDDPHAAPYDLAFAAGSAWVTQPELDQVWRMTPGLGHGIGGIEYSTVAVPGGPWTIATTGDGELWVQRENSKQLSRIIPTADSGRLGRTVGWGSQVFSSPRRGLLLAHNAGGTVGELGPSMLRSCDACAEVGLAEAHGHVFAALMTRRGLFVGTTRGTYFYDQHSMRSGGQPTASTGGGESLAPDGDGVVIGAGNGGLIHWVPGD